MSNLIQINKDEIYDLQIAGSKIIMTPEAEEQLMRLLALQQLVNDAVEEVKENIQAEANKIMPNFKGIVGEDVKIMHRAYGGKYSFKKENLEVIDKSFVKQQVRYTVDSKEVDKFVKDNNDLPAGINEAFRSPKLSITPNKEALEECKQKLIDNAQKGKQPLLN